MAVVSYGISVGRAVVVAGLWVSVSLPGAGHFQNKEGRKTDPAHALELSHPFNKRAYSGESRKEQPTTPVAIPPSNNRKTSALRDKPAVRFFDKSSEFRYRCGDDSIEGNQLPVPMPWTYRHASKEWRAFLDDVKERMSLESDNMAYTAVDAVLQVFRRRLNAQEGLEFASVLPSVLCAIFVHNWDVTEPRAEFFDRERLVSEVKAVRVNHNLTPDNAIEATAWAVRRSTNRRDFERVLAKLPAEACDFWHVDVTDPAELEQRII